MASTRSSFEIAHFDRAIKSSLSALGDQDIKEITSLQRQVILGFLKGRDTFACLPTGYGKSLIFQLAVRVAAELSVVSKDLFPTEPVVLVVSPLNALIKDQLSSCEKLGIKATKIEGSELPSLEGIEIVYVSPETLIGLITVSDAILTGRQSGQKLQCLYGNPMAKNFFQNRILRNL